MPGSSCQRRDDYYHEAHYTSGRATARVLALELGARKRTLISRCRCVASDHSVVRPQSSASTWPSSAADIGLVMRFGWGIGTDVLHLAAIGAGVDRAPFQSLDRSPGVATQHASKDHGDQLPHSRREAHRRACRSRSRDQPLASSTVISRVLDCNPDPTPSYAAVGAVVSGRSGTGTPRCEPRYR
jgi:hypothetical protein